MSVLPNQGRPARPGQIAGALAVVLLAAACAGPSRQPLPAFQPDIPPTLPLQGAAASAQSLPALHWRDLAPDPALQRLVALALANNRDLRVAMLNVQRAQAQMTATEANQRPTVGLGLNAQRAPNSSGNQSNSFSAGMQLASWEIDLFGRLQSASDAARAQWLASDAGRRAAEMALVAQVLSTALAVRTDDALLAVARNTLTSRDETLRLVRLREQAGASSALDLQAQLALSAQARATLAQLQRQRAQDENALALLLGQPVPADALPPGGEHIALLAEVPVGLPSAVLLQRPDVMQAEAQLAAAQANIHAARAALWPSISLTAQAGQASSALSGLLQGGNFGYSLAASALMTVFDSGRREANIGSADSAGRIALAQYEKVVQTAFRETADALAGLGTWREQVAAVQQQRDAARDTARLVDLKLQQGASNVLEQQDAQRSLFAAEQLLLQTRLAELNNRVALFKAVGR